jgi:hypothetical protein
MIDTAGDKGVRGSSVGIESPANLRETHYRHMREGAHTVATLAQSL